MNKKLFKPKVIYFGLYNSPETFQRMMSNIFRELLHKEILINYMNNFIISTKTKKELEKRTVQFLKVAEKYNLYFKQLKYDFNIKEIFILRVVVGQKEVQIEHNKIKVVKK